MGTRGRTGPWRRQHQVKPFNIGLAAVEANQIEGQTMPPLHRLDGKKTIDPWTCQWGSTSSMDAQQGQQDTWIQTQWGVTDACHTQSPSTNEYTILISHPEMNKISLNDTINKLAWVVNYKDWDTMTAADFEMPLTSDG